MQHLEEKSLDKSWRNYKEYENSLRKFMGNKYKISAIPLIITTEEYFKLSEAVNRVLEIFSDQKFIDNINKDWFLPVTPTKKAGFFGCIDFHFHDKEYKAIEINMFPPGLSTFMEQMEEKMLELYSLERISRTAEGFEKKLIDNITSNGKYKKVLICDYRIEDEYSLAEYKYIKKLLEENNIECDLADARDIKVSPDKKPIHKNKVYDLVYNRIIPCTWEERKDELQNYSELYIENPEIFFINPSNWIFSKKNIMDKIKKYEEINNPNSKLFEAFLKGNKLSEFETIEELRKIYPSFRKTVLKPLDGFASKGVLPKPSHPIIQEIFNSTDKNLYYIQEFFPAGKLKYPINNGINTDLKYDVRVVFLGGKICGLYTRIYEGFITNFRGNLGGLAPVFVTK